MSKQSNVQSESAQQSIEELQQRYQALHTRKIQTETQRDAALERLDELKTESKQKYGTDDVETLKLQLQQMNEENERKRKEYQASLDLIEQELAAVEEKFRDTTSNENVDQEPE